MKWLVIALLCAKCLTAQSYDGPRPPKPDLPYLIHADNLVPTESTEAKMDEREQRKGDQLYIIDGANSTARTPLGSPSFLIQTDQLQADQLQCFRLTSKNGHREILIRRKKKMVAQPVRLNVVKVGDNLYKISVDEILDNGEYALSPAESNQAFCFQVY